MLNDILEHEEVKKTKEEIKEEKLKKKQKLEERKQIIAQEIMEKFQTI